MKFCILKECNKEKQYEEWKKVSCFCDQSCLKNSGVDIMIMIEEKLKRVWGGFIWI